MEPEVGEVYSFKSARDFLALMLGFFNNEVAKTGDNRGKKDAN